MSELIKQSSDLFDQIEWQMPVNAAQAKSIAVIGGNSEGFLNLVKSFEYLNTANLGSNYLVAPASMRKIVPPTLEVEFIDATPSGSLANPDRLPEILLRTDHLFVAGDLSKNSQTQLFIEKLLSTDTPATLAGDSAYYLESFMPQNCTIIADFQSMQKIIKANKFERPLLSTNGSKQMAEALSVASIASRNALVMVDQNNIYVAVGNNVSMTVSDGEVNSNKLAAQMAAYSANIVDDRFAILSHVAWLNR